jgi:glyoxylase-like metal-dependent hydrolase (beta-lactamase superfamily II)
MAVYGATMQVLQPYKNILAFYDGRVPGVRLFGPAENWLDDGAYALGIASYAIIDGEEALVYDAHISLTHARMIRAELVRRGVKHIRLVLSHFHDDHVAGNAVFADCEIIASVQTYEALMANKAAIESAIPPIMPLVMPNRMFDGELVLKIGHTEVVLRHADIHSFDAALALLPAQKILLAGDALEDPVTYVAEPERLQAHLDDLARVTGWLFERILPNHGAAEVIAAGGYDRRLIAATRLYVEALLALRADPARGSLPLQDFAADAFATGGISYFEPYEAVHARNVVAVLQR